MKFNDFLNKSEDELKTIVLDTKKQLYKLRLQKNSGEIADTTQFSKNRKTVAKAITRLNQLKKGIKVVEKKVSKKEARVKKRVKK
jgi:ribosomal protein L29